MEVEVLTKEISVIFRWKGEDSSYANINVICTIDHTGYIDCGSPEDIYNLLEMEIAEWRAIGPEDSELFLTNEWFTKLALGTAFGNLPEGWRKFDID